MVNPSEKLSKSVVVKQEKSDNLFVFGVAGAICVVVGFMFWAFYDAGKKAGMEIGWNKHSDYSKEFEKTYGKYYNLSADTYFDDYLSQTKKNADIERRLDDQNWRLFYACLKLERYIDGGDSIWACEKQALMNAHSYVLPDYRDLDSYDELMPAKYRQ